MKHPIRFGALVTSVGEARRAEELGYDLVAVPDDPAVPDYSAACRVLIIGPSRTGAELLALGADTFLVRADALAPLTPWETLREAAGSSVFRPSSVRAKRRPGIDYDAVPASLADSAVEPGDLDNARVRSTYTRGGSPGLVLRPRTTAEVVDALARLRELKHRYDPDNLFRDNFNIQAATR